MCLKKKIDSRCDQLFDLEMIFNFEYSSYVGKNSYNKDFNLHQLEIAYDSDEEWNKKINKLKKELKERKNGKNN